METEAPMEQSTAGTTGRTGSAGRWVRGLALIVGLTAAGSGCRGNAVLPIAVFAAAATAQTIGAVATHCAREDVDCSQDSSSSREVYESHEDPYSSGVDW